MDPIRVSRDQIALITKDHTVIKALERVFTAIDAATNSGPLDLNQIRIDVAVLQGQVTVLQGKMITAEADIDALQTAVGILQGAVTTIQNALAQVVTLTNSTETVSSIAVQTTFVLNPAATQTVDISAGATTGISITFTNPSNFISTITLKTGVTYVLNPMNTLMLSWDGTQWEIINSPSGAAIGNWTSYTPTWTSLTVGTGSTSTYRWRRVGSNMEIEGQCSLGTSPSMGGTSPQCDNIC